MEHRVARRRGNAQPCSHAQTPESAASLTRCLVTISWLARGCAHGADAPILTALTTPRAWLLSVTVEVRGLEYGGVGFHMFSCPWIAAGLARHANVTIWVQGRGSGLQPTTT